MTLLGYIYGALGAVAMGVTVIDNLTQKRSVVDPSGVLAGFGMVMLWVIYNSLSALHLPDSFVVYALMDLAALVGVVRLYRHRRAKWKLVLAFAFLAQLCLHVVYGGLSDRSPMTNWRYTTGLDVFYVVAVFAIATPGGWHGIRYLRRLLDHRRVAPQKVVRR